ncbi:MAG: hypothetical protein GY779_02770 [Gammaproteobacteria bacterium]|nr:hypothetical protein [Gammaproteobacteria bacterium]
MSTTTQAPYTEDELQSVLQTWINNAVSFDETDLVENRTKAWQMYLMQYPDQVLPSKDGFSSAMATDLADSVEAVLAQIMPAFSSDCIVEFTPMGIGDEDQADAETMACNQMFMQSNAGWTQMYTALKSALLFKNGIIKVWVEEGENGRTFEIEAVETARFLIDSNHNEQDIQGVSFCGERKGQLTRSDLIGMGIEPEKLENLGTAGTGAWQSDLIAKQVGEITDFADSPTEDQDKIEVIDCYVKIDLTGNGKATQMRYLVAVDSESVQTILLEEPVEFIPFATGTAFIVPNRWSGLSLYDKLKELVLNKSFTLRQWLDNSNIVNNSRYEAVEGQVNMDDALNVRPGGIVRTKAPGSLNPVAGIDQGASLGSLLTYWDQRRTEAAGSALDLQGAEGELVKANVTAMSADRQLSNLEMLSALMSRTLGETLFRSLYALIHATLRTYWDQPIMLNKSGNWTAQDPSQWPARSAMTIKAGMSPGERHRKVANLDYNLQLMMQLMQAGSPLVSPNNLHNLISDRNIAADVQGSDKYFTDPDSPQGQQAMMQMQQNQAQQSQMQMQMQQMQIQMEQQAFQLEAQKVQIDQVKVEADIADDLFDNETDRLKLAQDAEIKEAEIVASIHQSTVQADASRDKRTGSGES